MILVRDVFNDDVLLASERRFMLYDYVPFSGPRRLICGTASLVGREVAGRRMLTMGFAMHRM